MKSKISFGDGKPDIEVTPPGVSLTLEYRPSLNFAADIPLDQKTWDFIANLVNKGEAVEMVCDDPEHGKYKASVIITKAEIDQERNLILVDIEGEIIK